MLSRHTLHSFILTFLSYSRNVQAAQHIVLLDQSHPSNPQLDEVLQRVNLHCEHAAVSHIWNNSAFSGFAADIKDIHADHLNAMEDILVAEKSVGVATTGVIRRDIPLWNRPNATWGLERISSAFFQGTDPDGLDFTYTLEGEEPGKGVDIYLLDSGLWPEHNGFGGRAEFVYSFDGKYEDDLGHGNHVAGTAGAIDFGVASSANILGVRILGQSAGTTGSTIDGIDYVVKQHLGRRTSESFVGSVMSMSLAASAQVDALDHAIAAAVAVGIHVCVAAGNSGKDACDESPGSAGGDNGPAIVVGAIGIEGKHSSFSNFGKCVDVYAPGEYVLSAALHDPDTLTFMSGTSQATPHVSGLVAYAMANKTLADSPALMKAWIRNKALALGDGTVLANNGADLDAEEGMIGLTKADAPVHASNFIAAKSGYKADTSARRDVGMSRKWMIPDIGLADRRAWN